MTDSTITVIRPKRGLFDWDLARIWQSRDLLFLFARRDITVRYRQTLLGPVWLILQPLVLTGVFTSTLSGMIHLSTGGQPAPLFYLTGLLIWSYFSQSVQSIAPFFNANESLFSKVYFPRILVPLSTLISSAVATAIQLVVVVLFLAWYALAGRAVISWHLMLLPFVIFQVAMISLALGLCIAASAAKYRDLAQVTPFLIQLSLFVTPVIYPYSAISPNHRLIVSFLNPLAAAVEESRWCFLGSGALDFWQLMASLVSLTALLLLGLLLFHRVERTAMDTI